MSNQLFYFLTYIIVLGRLVIVKKYNLIFKSKYPFWGPQAQKIYFTKFVTVLLKFASEITVGVQINMVLAAIL